jgi:hypothetical protein
LQHTQDKNRIQRLQIHPDKQLVARTRGIKSEGFL